MLQFAIIPLAEVSPVPLWAGWLTVLLCWEHAESR